MTSRNRNPRLHAVLAHSTKWCTSMSAVSPSVTVRTPKAQLRPSESISLLQSHATCRSALTHPVGSLFHPAISHAHPLSSQAPPAGSAAHLLRPRALRLRQG